MSDDPDSLFFRARKITDPSEREAFLSSACGHSPALRERIDQLLANEAAAESFFPEVDAKEAANLPLATPLASGVVPAEQEGQVIDRYKLLEQIGEGGFGTVWMAEQTVPVTRRVALKIIKQGMDTKEVIARFEAERQALAMMDHPNIAKVLDAGATDTGRPFFVMELVDGQPVTQFCNERRLNTRQRLELFGEICGAVNHAHQKGIIHRDIKPSNVMVMLRGDKPVPKVIDFGIAKAVEGKLTDKTVFTRFNQFIGTPVYMSPEQAALSGLDIDTRSDIYSLGILLYELLTGKPPFDSKSLLSAGYDEMRRIIREDEPPIPSRRISTVSGEERTHLTTSHGTDFGKLSRYLKGDLDWIVMRAIEKNRTQRYQSANGLAMDIQRFLKDEPVSATPPSAAYRLQKTWRRNKVVLTTTGVVMVTLVLGVIVSGQQAARAVKAEKISEQRLEESEKARQDAEHFAFEKRERLIQLYVGNGVERIRSGEPAQSLPWLVKALELDAANTVRQEVHRIRIAQALKQTPQLYRSWTKPGIGTTVGFSGDGEFAFANGATLGGKGRSDGGLSVWNVESGEAVEFDEPMDQILYAAFARQGARLATVSRAGIIYLYDLASGQPPIKFLSHHPQGHHLLFSPDGSRLLSYGYNRLAKLWDTETGSLLIPSFDIKEGSNLRSADFSPDGRSVSILNYNGFTHTLDVATGGISLPVARHQGRPVLLQYSSDGSVFATPGRTQRPAVFLWDADSGIQTAAFEQDHDLSYFDVSPDGAKLAVATLGPAGDVHVYDIHKHEKLFSTKAHGAMVSMVRFSPDSSFLTAVSWDHATRVWDVSTGNEMGSTMWHSAALRSVDFHPSGKFLITGCVDGTVRMWSLVSDPTPSFTLSSVEAAIGMVVDRERNRLLTLNRGGSLESWAFDEEMVPTRTALATGYTLEQAAYLHGGGVVAIATSEPALRFWSLNDGGLLDEAIFQDVGQLSGSGSHTEFVVTPDASLAMLASSTPDNSVVQFFDIERKAPRGQPLPGKDVRLLRLSLDGNTLAVVQGHESFLGHTLGFWSTKTGRKIGNTIELQGFSAVGDFSPDGSKFALQTQTVPIAHEPDLSTVQAWDVNTGTVVLEPKVWSGNPLALRYHPSGNRIAIAHDNRLRMVDATTGQPVTPPMYHRQDVSSVDIEPAGLFICSTDGTDLLYVHVVDSGQPATVPIRHPDVVLDARYSNDGRHIISLCRDGRVRLWDMAPELAPIEELTLRAELLAGHRVDNTDALSPLSGEECGIQWQSWIGMLPYGLTSISMELERDPGKVIVDSGLTPPIKGMGQRTNTTRARESSGLRNRRVSVDSSGNFSLNLEGITITNLAKRLFPPLTHLDLDHTQIQDLSALEGLPLRELNLRSTQVTDLSPLKGMPLRFLTIDSPLEDIRSLEGLPLTNLWLVASNVSDISALSQMDLVHLWVAADGLRDISPLQGLPLEELRLSECPSITNFQALLECKRLKRLMVHPNSRAALEVLRQHPALEHIVLGTPRNWDWDQVPTIKEFWRHYDGDVSAVETVASSKGVASSDAAPNPYATMQLAVRQLWSGNEDAYMRTRRTALEWTNVDNRPASAERIAKLSALRPIDDMTLRETALAHARHAVESGRNDSALPWFGLALGMMEYRNADYLTAEKALMAAEQVKSTTYRPDLLLPAARFYRVMCLCRRGKVDEARQLHVLSEKAMPPLPVDELSALSDGSDHDYLILWLTYKEASAMLDEANQKSNQPRLER